MPAPTRDPRTVLATGALLLVPLAALWLLVSPQLTEPPGLPGAPGRTDRRDGTPRAGDPGGPPDAPPPRVVAGAPAQADFTLLGVTLASRSGALTPPPPLAPPVGRGEPSGLARNPFLQGAPRAAAVWIGVRGGLGIQTLMVPQDGRRHAYRFGRFVFVATSLRSRLGVSTGMTTQWTGPGGGPLSDLPAQPPYTLLTSWQTVAPGHPPAEVMVFMPTWLSDRFQVTALPLSTAGRPTGRAVTLTCQAVTADALMVQIPPGYSRATRQFRVTVARAGAKAGIKTASGASWLLADLPPAAGSDRLAPPAAAAHAGPFTLRAVAAEAPDTSGVEDPGNRRPPRRTGPYRQNVDGHLWTGVPTVRYLLTASASAPLPPGQSWLFQLDTVTPQWSSPARGPAFGKERSLGLFPLTAAVSLTPRTPWVVQDGEAGAAYPGQQQRLEIDGTAIRSQTRTETVTFHDAAVVHDPGFGGDRIVWHHSETRTTPSGITVTVLNGRPGRRDTTDPSPAQSPFGTSWWYDRGNAELLLAWRLPNGFISGQHATLNAPKVAFPPQGLAVPGTLGVPGVFGFAPGRDVPPGTLLAAWDETRSDPYVRAAAPPGAQDASAVTRAGSALLRLSVWQAQTPKRTPAAPPLLRPAGTPPAPASPAVRPSLPAPAKPLPPYSWRDGPDILTAAPLPRHLKTITLQITLREEQERRPVHLVAPVWPVLPPGADLDAPRPVPPPVPVPILRPVPASTFSFRPLGRPGSLSGQAARPVLDSVWVR